MPVMSCLGVMLCSHFCTGSLQSFYELDFIVSWTQHTFVGNLSYQFVYTYIILVTYMLVI